MMNKNIIIITGGSNGLGKALVNCALQNNLFVCNIDKEERLLENNNYKCYVGDYYPFFIVYLIIDYLFNFYFFYLSSKIFLV